VSDILPNDAQDVAKDTRDPETGPYRGAPGRLAGMRSLTIPERVPMSIPVVTPGKSTLLEGVMDFYVDGVPVPYDNLELFIPTWTSPWLEETPLSALKPRPVKITVKPLGGGPTMHFAVPTVAIAYNDGKWRLDISVEGPDVGTPSAQEEGNRGA
jgi:hypothetical protein